jgi:aspartokinase/homoserine dehydrogenase 1
MIVSKFGGTSVGSAENIEKVIEIAKQKKDKVAVVVSALGGVTNQLIHASELSLQTDPGHQEIVNELENRHNEAIDRLLQGDFREAALQFVQATLDELRMILQGVSLLSDLSGKSAARIVSTGEVLSSYLITMAMKQQGLNAALKDSRELIQTDDAFQNAQVNYEFTYSKIGDFFSSTEADIIVMPGFIASNERGETTTLGRGGSDFTAALIANGANADSLEIWTDVSGMYTANPKLVRQAKPIESISYQEAMELSHFGAKVLYPPTVQPALDKGIDILIKNTMEPEAAGTRITERDKVNGSLIKGISHIEDIALLTLEGNGMVGVPGISSRLFGALADEQINVKFITQASSEHSICLAIDAEDTEPAKKAVDQEFEFEILKKRVDPIVVEKHLAIIALVGDQMKSHQGISGKMFSELGHNNVNIRAIAQGSSERNISAVIRDEDVKKALNVLHASFFEAQIKQLNLFIVGIGNVGGKLLDQIGSQQEFLIEKKNLQLRVIGIANSRKMLFEEEGISLDNWQQRLEAHGEASDLDHFYSKMSDLNMRNSVFIDNTANEKVTELYARCLRESIAVVACNKIACSSAFENYEELKGLSRKYQAPFLFETNVGAGLPIIDTLHNLIASGDQIHEIQAVLSGSLNFVFNNFLGERSFYEVVKQAGEEGYTEPDPRIDLSGVDVARKILILMRESGIRAELEDIENRSFLPEESLQAETVSDFMESLKATAPHFENLRKKADQAGSKLKYVASFKDGKAQVGLQHIASDHPFYNLDGKDNIVLFYTDRYKEQPLIIKGAGAGAEVTASGIFGDIIRTGNL